MNWRSFVALGDSFTEGIDDPYPDGTRYRGWADLVAGRLAADSTERGDEFHYANLAVRGRAGVAGPPVVGRPAGAWGRGGRRRRRHAAAVAGS